MATTEEQRQMIQEVSNRVLKRTAELKKQARQVSKVQMADMMKEEIDKVLAEKK